MASSILLVTKKIVFLNRYALSYLIWGDTKNTLKTVEKNMSFVIKYDNVLDK